MRYVPFSTCSNSNRRLEELLKRHSENNEIIEFATRSVMDMVVSKAIQPYGLCCATVAYKSYEMLSQSWFD